MSSPSNPFSPPSPSSPLSPSPPSPCPHPFFQLGKELNYYFKFCVASYGAPIQVYLNPCTGPITLCIAARWVCPLPRPYPHSLLATPTHRGCCCCNCCQLEQFDGDTCFPNSAAIRDIAGVRPENLIHGSFINCVCRVPFYVAEDWDPQTGKTRVIVAIRGTLSLQVVRRGVVMGVVNVLCLRMHSQMSL